MTGGLPGGSKAPKWSKPGVWREAAELASAAARAEGASTTGEPSNRRVDGSDTAATSPRAVGVGLAVAADQAEQAGPLLGVGGDQQPHGRGSAAARQPRGGALAVLAVAGEATRDSRELSAWLDLLAS
jgi:hypothetical protein